MPLSSAAKQEFLAQPHVAAFAVAEPGRGPLTVPLWYDYHPGGRPSIMISPGSRKAVALEAAGRFSLMVDTVTPRTMYVSVEGPVATSRSASNDEVRSLAERYLSGAELENYLDFAFNQLGEHLTIEMNPEHWLGADLTEM